MYHLSLHMLPKEVYSEAVWKQYAQKMRPLRLKSLQSDPASFISKYASEVEEPITFWIGRLKEPSAWTIIMVRTQNMLSDTATADGSLLREDVEWVAYCVIIDVRHIPESMAQREGGTLSQHEEPWFMAAIWLDPTLRGQGAGQKLVQFAIDSISVENARTSPAGGKCMTNVSHGNDRALGLYKKIGFRVTDAHKTTDKNGEIQHMTELKLRLQ